MTETTMKNQEILNALNEKIRAAEEALLYLNQSKAGLERVIANSKKSPVEEAYKKVYGKYPVKEVSEELTPKDSWNVVSWSAFQNGYNSAYEEKVEEQGTWNYDPAAKFRKQEEVNTIQEKEWTYKITDEKGETNPYKQYLNSKKPTSLYDCIADWWDDVFTAHSDLNMEASIESLVKRIIEFLPDEINESSACDDWDIAWNSGYNAYRQMLLKKINGK